MREFTQMEVEHFFLPNEEPLLSDMNKEGTPDDHLDVGEIDKLIRNKTPRPNKEAI